MRKVLVLSLILLADVMAWAQMSDEKIIEFVQEQQANGASQEQIVLELNRKGVSIQQLQRMRDKHEKQYSTGVLGNTIQSQGVNSRSRNEVSQSSNLFQGDRIDNKRSTAGLTEQERMQAMYDESMFLFADSLALLKMSLIPKKEI